MIDKKEFAHLLVNYRQLVKYSHDSLKFVSEQHEDHYWKFIEQYNKLILTEDGAELVYWWLYDSSPKKIYHTDKSRHKKTYDVESAENFAEYLVKRKELYFKGV